jgi:hypothetical protein
MRTHLLILQGGKRPLIVTLVNNQQFLLNTVFGLRNVSLANPITIGICGPYKLAITKTVVMPHPPRNAPISG